MTKADLLILQDAAEEFSLESAENLGVNKSVCLQTAALAILCRVVSSLMAGEGEAQKPVVDVRSWNAAINAACLAISGHQALNIPAANYGKEILEAVRALRKPAQEEVK